MAQAKKSVVSTFSLAMMTAAAVVSLRGLPMMAKEQLTLFVYIAFATFIFLIPAALVSAELGGAFGEKGGGVYTWVKEAFGARWGFVAIWLQWIQNVVWYPTVLAFSAAAIAYVVGEPKLANNGSYVGAFCIIAYWAATWVTLRGVDAIARVTSWAFLAGTVLPGVIIMALAVIWIVQGNPIAMLHPAATDSASVMSMAGGHAHPRYLLMYAAAIRLRYSQPDLKRSYRVPGGTVGMWCISGVGFAGVAFAFLVGFFPPTQLPVGSPALYIGLVVGGTVVFTGLPLLIGMVKQASWRAVSPPGTSAAHAD
jgi:amino acid transporter